MPPIRSTLRTAVRAHLTTLILRATTVPCGKTVRTVTIPVVSGTGRSVRTTDVGTMLQIGSSSLVFRSGKTGTLPARTRITNRAVSRSSANLTVSRRRGATGHSAIGNPAVIAVRTNLTANVGTTTANRTVTRHSISLTVNAVPTIGNPVGSGAATARSAAGTISSEVIPDTIPTNQRARYA